MAHALRQSNKRQTIKDQIVEWIREQRLMPGEQILSQNRLAEVFSTTAVTVHKALTELAEEGVVYREKGRGTFVGPQPTSTGRGSVCLVLPGEGLDRPERNPHYWPYVQFMLHAFMTSVNQGRHFMTSAVTPDMDEHDAARDLARHRVVFFHYTKQPKALLEYMVAEKKVPVVAFGQPVLGLECLTVDHDLLRGSHIAAEHLAGLGYRKIAFIGSSAWWGDIALQGYKQGLEACGLDAPAERVVRVGEGHLEGYRGAAELLERKVSFDAVYVQSDMRALDVIEHFRRAGVRVPEDVGVMGYDGLHNAVHQPPYLTTVRMPYPAMIHAALEEVERDGDKKHSPHKHIEFVGEVVEGKTCRPAEP